MSRYFPKILLLCNFSQSTANGITIRHLFKGWPKEQIAVAEVKCGIEEIYVPNISRYYILGSGESQFVWPFCHLRRQRPSAAYFLNEAPPALPIRKTKRKGLGIKLKSVLATLQVEFLQRSGLAMVSRSFRISSEFNAWVRDFNPALIYCATAGVSTLEFLDKLQRHLRVPVAIHVFDDFLDSKYKLTLFPHYWKNRLETAFRRIVGVADLHLAISEKMAAEYAERYGRPFYSFHNPIDPEVWLPEGSGKLKEPKEESENLVEEIRGRAGKKLGVTDGRRAVSAFASPFTFVYAGKINRDTVRPVIRFMEAMENLSKKGIMIRLKVYSPYPFEEIYRLLGDRANEVYQGKVAYTELPAALRSGDALLLPLDFTDATIRYIRLSMLTKVTEYMISGKPIFVFAPRNIAVSEYLQAHDAAIHCDDPDQLEETILTFINDKVGRERVIANAVRRAKEHHLMTAVGERLRALLEPVVEPEA